MSTHQTANLLLHLVRWPVGIAIENIDFKEVKHDLILLKIYVRHNAKISTPDQ